MHSGEGCAAIADSGGQLLFYTNGILAWNRLHQPLANGTALGGYAGPSNATPNSATQGAAIVAKPGSSTEYYIFTVDAAENDLQNGLRYSLVDISLQGRLGAVTAKAVPVPLGGGPLTEKLALVRHANQRDIWVLVHGWNNSLFYAFLLTPTGFTPTPVISSVGTVHQGGGGPRNNWNALGAMKVSPDGRRLALVKFGSGSVELSNFDVSTGLVSNARLLPNSFSYYNYGVEFSPSSQLLYVTNEDGLTQYNLRTGSILPLNWTCRYGALQLGPDGRIYQVTVNDNRQIGIISQPDQPGLACAYQPSGIILPPGMNAELGLPTVLVTPLDPTQAVDATRQVIIPNIITPNQDQLNDKLVVQNLVPGTYALTIYNRWGRVIYQQVKYDNTWEAADQADGIYYYVVTTDTGQRYMGWLEVLR